MAELDLGIETCFIEDLDCYWKTWLQFVFPLYLWVIAFVIIILSLYSQRMTNNYVWNKLGPSIIISDTLPSLAH